MVMYATFRGLSLQRSWGLIQGLALVQYPEHRLFKLTVQQRTQRLAAREMGSLGRGAALGLSLALPTTWNFKFKLVANFATVRG